MTSLLVALASGALFGAGLVLSGMTQPEKVAHFLDFTGDWDPSLAFVMGGALAVMVAAYTVARRLRPSLLTSLFALSDPPGINPRLVAGAAIFGVGWGLSGICPGPALVGAGALRSTMLVFVPAMVAGMLLTHLWDHLLSRSSSSLPDDLNPSSGCG